MAKKAGVSRNAPPTLNKISKQPSLRSYMNPPISLPVRVSSIAPQES